jgi:hypothetical protein
MVAASAVSGMNLLDPAAQIGAGPKWVDHVHHVGRHHRRQSSLGHAAYGGAEVAHVFHDVLLGG